PKFRGRYLVQVFDNRDVDNKDFTNQRFTNSLKFAVSNAFLPSLDFNFYVNHTYSKRNSTIAKNENYYSLYQAEVLYKNPGFPFYFAFGRTYSLGSASAGNLNGGEFGYKFSENFKGGIYGGKESATENNKLLGDGNKFGTYLVYQKQNYNSTLSFNQKNVSGKVDEQFLTFQNFFSSNRKFSFNQSGDLYLKNNDESKIQLRRIFVSTNYTFLENWRFSANYNAYKNIKVDETSAIPDSLFNDRFSQTIGLRTSYNSAWKTDFAFGLVSRFSQGITHPVLGVNLDVNFRERLGMDFLRTSVNYYNSSVSNTVRTRISAEKTLFENFTTEVEFGNYFYSPTSGNSDFSLSAGGNFSYCFGRFYSDLSLEYDFGSTNYFQTVLAVGINF
ncbi:hypothetical protein IT568_07695, partial [bacterium]|nr:hypothetical protein [bacterium]